MHIGPCHSGPCTLLGCAACQISVQQRPLPQPSTLTAVTVGIPKGSALWCPAAVSAGTGLTSGCGQKGRFRITVLVFGEMQLGVIRSSTHLTHPCCASQSPLPFDSSLTACTALLTGNVTGIACATAEEVLTKKWTGAAARQLVGGCRVSGCKINASGCSAWCELIFRPCKSLH
jgi:hypothetical protein